MKKIKYKVTGCFGDSNEGDIVDAYILAGSVDDGVALVYHPKTSKYTCASLGFCIEKQDGYWVDANQNSSGNDRDYINITSQKELNTLAENAGALIYRRKAQVK